MTLVAVSLKSSHAALGANITTADFSSNFSHYSKKSKHVFLLFLTVPLTTNNNRKCNKTNNNKTKTTTKKRTEKRKGKKQ